MQSAAFKDERSGKQEYFHLKTGYLLITKKIHKCIFTARKRSLGQGNVFTPVFHSVHKGWGAGFPPCITGHMTMGVCLKGGVYPGGWADHPLQSKWDTMGYGQQASCTHPIGMHSCFSVFSMT